MHSRHTQIADLLCDILLYSTYDRLRYVSVEVKPVYFCAPHLLSDVAVRDRLTVNRISPEKVLHSS